MRYLLAFVAILAMKLALLAMSGPIVTPDTAGYVEFSDDILAGTAWLSDAGVERSYIPPSAFRMLGYPMLIAGARVLFGEGWRWALVALQMALSLLALAGLAALRRPLGLSHGAMLLTLVAVATSSSLVLDAALLTDSLNASLTMSAVTLLALASLREHPLRPSAALGAGLLLALSFLLREAMSYLWLALLPLIAVATGLVAARRQGRPPLLRRLTCAVLTLLPLCAAYVAYQEWNRQRTGTAFVTTSAQITMLMPLVAAAGHEPAIFAGDSPLDQAARASLTRYDLADIHAIDRRLFETWHLPATAVAAAADGKYFEVWRDRPLALARVALGHLRENEVFLLFRPVDALREYRLWSTGVPSELGRWKSVAADKRMLPLYLLEIADKLVAAALFGGFLLLAPWRAWRQPRSAASHTGFALWLLYLGWLAIYAAVYLETRYMAPVLPFAILLGVASLAWRRQGGDRPSRSIVERASPRR